MSSAGTASHSPRRAWLGVAAITASLFVFVTTELMPVGLLTPMSGGLAVSVGVAGMVVTGYGISAGVGVPFIVAWTRRVDRRVLLAALLVILAAGNLITARSPDFTVVLITRLIMGFAHGVFWAIGVSMATRLVPEHASRAAAVVLSGMSIGIVAGVPMGTFIANLTDWRTTFTIWAALSVAVCLLVAATVPSLPSSDAVPVRQIFQLPVRNGRLRAVMVTVALYVLGHFAAYTFIRPFMESRAAVSSDMITVLLIVFGVGGAVGNFVAAHTVTKNMKATFVVSCAGIVASLMLLLLIGGHTPGLAISVALWGLAFGGANLCQVNMLLAAAPDAFEAAMALNTMGYNISIALGALLGGLFANNLGLTGAMWFGVALTAAALLSAFATVRSNRPRTPTPAQATDRPAAHDPATTTDQGHQR